MPILLDFMKVKKLPTHSFQEIWSLQTIKESKPILQAILSDVSFISACEICKIEHYYGYKTSIEFINGVLKISEGESPGNIFIKKEGSEDFNDYSYEKLKTYINKKNIFYPSIVLNKCLPKERCFHCNATGDCSNCKGEQVIECPGCNGSATCPTCNGKGKYQCQDCYASGDCPECNGSGDIFCIKCNGSGDISCKKCDGTGRYTLHNGKEVDCRVCDGTGVYQQCDACEGEGIISCYQCNGNGRCKKCDGTGDVKCKSCRESGVCGKCRGERIIKCPECKGGGACIECQGSKEVLCRRCKGTGKFQSYKTFTIEEKEPNKKVYSSIDVNQEILQEISGDLLYEDIVYEFFHKQLIIDNFQSSCIGLDVSYINSYKEWLILNRWINESWINERSDIDSYVKVNVRNERIPVTKIDAVTNSKNFSIYIIGNNNIACYDNLPSYLNRLVGYIKTRF